MNGLFWILVGGIAGWLTGRIVGDEGYEKVLRPGHAKGLDIVLGIIGASIAGYVFSGTVNEASSSFSTYATAVLGSITLVGIFQLVIRRVLTA